MRRLVLALLGLLNACGQDGAAPHESRPPAAPEQPRLLVVGWDGASFRMIDPLLAAGKLPHLAGLIERGLRAPLESTLIPISSAAWPAATTGRGPGETGVFSFFAPVPGSYELALVSSRSNRAPPLWRILTARGVPSFVFGVPLTYPPEPILGTMVCGMLAPPGADFAWPGGLAERLRARGFRPDLEPWHEEREATREEAEAQLDLRAELLPELLRERDWRLAWIVFKELDALSHLTYGVDFAAAVGPIYERLDALLGALLELAGPDANVIVLSDHGFTTYARGLNLHEWLLQEGFALRREGAGAVELPLGPYAQQFAREASQRLEEFELAHTQAYAFACAGNFGSLRLNLRGREPLGAVLPEEVEGVLARLEQRLRAHPWVVRTLRASECLPGGERAALPELLLETLPDVQVFAERGAPLSGTYPHPLADHELEGVFVAAGPGFRRGAGTAHLDLQAIAPLALHLLGQPVLAEMRGQVPLTLLTGERPVERVSGAEIQGLLPLPAGATPYTPEEIEALARSLGALGYGD
jgi:predicted AlkP superfamily phosphohydrolase/phosphomutase